jgi:KaiC/GvpD/RAD55 family RecA-like ATPase
VDTLHATVFPDVFAQMAARQDLDILKLQRSPPTAEEKACLSLLKLADFEDRPNGSGCLRYDENVSAIWGAEVDYDEGLMPFSEVAGKLKQAGVEAFLYTSPSHTKESPRWRILLPFSKPCAGSTKQMRDYRSEAVRQVETILGTRVASESFTLSQIFYFGKVEGSEYRTAHISGIPIDRLFDLTKHTPRLGKTLSDGFTVKAGVDCSETSAKIAEGKELHTSMRDQAASLIARGVPQEDVIALLQSQLNRSDAPRDKRWQQRYDSIERLVESAVAKFLPIEAHAAETMTKAVSLGEALRSLCKVTKQDVANIKQEEHLYGKTIPQGQLIAVVGPPNAGKTIIMEYICTHIAAEVLYINMDISGAQIPRAERVAEQGGYDLLCPDIKPGVSVEDVLATLNAYATSDQDLAGIVIVIDTLKKMVDIINKHEARRLYAMLRALTGRGASVICLSHTNKFKQEENGERWYMYEGTGDLRADFDAMCLLEAHIGDYGLITTSIYWREQGWPWAKDRGLVEPLSWTIEKDNDLEVVQLDEWVDTHALNKEAAEVRKVADLIEDVRSLLTGSPGQCLTRSAIVERMKGRHSQRQLDKYLPRYIDKAWTVEKGEFNADVYRPIKGFRTWGK